MISTLVWLLACGSGGPEPEVISRGSADGEGDAAELTVGKQGGDATERLSAPLIRDAPPPGPTPPPPAVSAAQCNQLQDGGEVKGPGCVTEVLTCGQTVIGHTRGGVEKFDTRFYERNQCWPATEDKSDGDERVYRLDMPDGMTTATITLDTPCADLDVMAFPWSGADCPSEDASIKRCEMQRQKGTKRERLHLVSDRATSWFVVVEGNGQADGTFGLTVQCEGVE